MFKISLSYSSSLMQHKKNKASISHNVFYQLIAVLLLMSCAIVSAQTIVVNQEGYFPDAEKSAFIFSYGPLETTLDATKTYRLALIANDSNENLAAYATPYVYPGELLNYLGVAPNQTFTPHPAGGVQIGNPTGAWMYEWNFEDYVTDSSINTYRVEIQGQPVAGNSVVISSSFPFVISNSRMESKYEELANAAFKYFYAHRLGEPTLPEFLTAEGFAPEEIAHEAFHGVAVPCFRDWCGDGDMSNGGPFVGQGTAWADAADFGMYPVNHAVAAWTMLNLIEFQTQAYEVDAAIPGSSSDWYERSEEGELRRYNLAKEVEVGSSWLLNLAPPGNQLYPHKIHNQGWDTASAWNKATEAAIKPATDDQTEYTQRSATVPSTAATYAACRTTAHMARVMTNFGKPEANTWLSSAVLAANTADSNATVLYPQSYASDYASLKESDEYYAGGKLSFGGGPYGDNEISDDQFACYVELYLAHYAVNPTGGDTRTYRGKVRRHTQYSRWKYLDPDISYVNARTPAILSLLVAENDLPKTEIDGFKNALYWAAVGDLVSLDTETESYNGMKVAEVPRYPHPWTSHADNWWWGSNPSALAHGIFLSHAAKFADPIADVQTQTTPREFAAAALRTMDYILGSNYINLSFVTGFGDNAEPQTHDRMAYAAKVAYPRGWLSGGPQNDWASCMGAEVNWGGGISWELHTDYWAMQDGSAAGTHDVYDNGFVGPAITVDEDEGTPSDTDDNSYVYEITGTIDVDVSSDLVAKYLSERTRWGVEAKLPNHRPKNMLVAYAAGGVYAGDPDKGPNGWCTVENAINYNANLTWMATAAANYLHDVIELPQAGEGNVIVTEYPRDNNWEGNGHCVDLVLYNPNNYSVDWVAELEVTGQITEFWNADWTQEGNKVIATADEDSSWGKTLGPHQSTSLDWFGYCAENYPDGSGNTPPPPPSDSNFTIDVTDDFGNGYCATLTVFNNSNSTWRDWSVAVTIEGRLQDYWNMTPEPATGSTFVVRGIEWNKDIEGNSQTKNIGFCALR